MVNVIYTDGSCLKNPGGPGGWAFIIIEREHIYKISGSFPETTNNRMELTAVIEALKFAKEKEYIIYTDSQLTMNCATGIWKRKANIDLWNEYDENLKERKISWKWVKAHNGDKYNEIVDKMARTEAKSVKK
jgi:ribonuclease HI